MTDNPCDTCGEDCLGGIIYGNCQHFRTWYKDHLHIGFALAQDFTHSKVRKSPPGQMTHYL